MSENLVAIFLSRHGGNEGKLALAWEGAAVCTFGELPARIGQYRAALGRLGVGPGDRVMVKTENSPAFVLTYLAVLASGAVFVPINSAYTAAEVALLVEDADPVLLVHSSATAMPPRRVFDFRPGGQNTPHPLNTPRPERASGERDVRRRSVRHNHDNPA